MHVPKGTNKIYLHFKLDCNKSNQSVSQINKTIIPNRWGCIEKGMSIWGLARYSVKMTAISGPFWKATTKPWNYLYGVFLVSSWLIGSGFYKKNQRSHTTNHTSHIMHHTFHIRKLTICLMYDFFQVRYKIKCDKKSENMRSSGFLICLTVGSRILRKNKKKIKLKEKKNT